MASIPGNVVFWHSEGWTPRNEALLEAVLKRARVTRHPWLMACHAKNRTHVEAPEKASTCRSKSAKGEWMEKVYDYVIACNSMRGTIAQMEVVEDFEPRRTKHCPFWWKEKRRCRKGMERAEAAKDVA